MKKNIADYSDEILSQLNIELENQKMRLIKSLQESFETVAGDIDRTLSDVDNVIKDNIKELRSMKK